MPTSSIHPRTLGLAAVVLIIAFAAFSPKVMGSRQSASAASQKIATVDLLSLLEDMLQTDDYKPGRDAYRAEWETRITDVQSRIQQVETELRMSAPTDPNVRVLQQQYQQFGYEFNQIRNEAGLGFDKFNADQAAEAYELLYTEAVSLAKALGYSHVFVTRTGGEITERGNLATVTQEILARPLALAPEDDTLTARLRERMQIPVPPEPEAEGEAAGDGEVGDDAAEGDESE